jgi:predicted dehydrogenase
MISHEAPSSVLNIGFGKAGSQLHLNSWRDNGFDIIAHDQNPDRLNPVNFPDAAREMFEAGRLTTVGNLTSLDRSPDVVDVVTSSGHHVDGIEQFLEVVQTKDLDAPKAWLVEKPVVSDEAEAARLLSLMESGDLNESSMFVNENYNASRGVEALDGLITEEQARGNQLTGVDVVFYKDRVPDVMKGRFTDPTLGAFGIELPHQLAIAYNLAGVTAGDRVDIEQNDYFKTVHGIEHSEATYTVLKTAENVEVRLAQGLGPFTMEADGHMNVADDPGIIRYAAVQFADGRSARVKFDPVPGVPRFHSVVEWQDENGESHELTIPDNTVQRVIGSVAAFAASGEREAYTNGLSVPNAINYSTTLLALRHEARDV